MWDAVEEPDQVVIDHGEGGVIGDVGQVCLESFPKLWCGRIAWS